MKIVGIIPARYGSTRLPGKPLANIDGKPMLVRVYEQVKKSKLLTKLYVAIDDIRLEECCLDYNIPYIMTGVEHRTAANRLQEVSESILADYYVQINGDEPLIDVEAIDSVIPDDVPQNIEFGTNIVTKIKNTQELMDPSNIKVVFSDDKDMLYMSRTPIPYPFRSTDFEYYKHVGIIGYNKKMLDFYANSTPGRLENIEGIDTLRFLDYGKQLKIVEIESYFSLSVDTANDLETVRRIIMNGGLDER